MTNTQYRAVLKRLGLSVYAAAKWLGVSLRTSQNYALGNTGIPEPTARLLRLVDRLGMSLDEASKLMC